MWKENDEKYAIIHEVLTRIEKDILCAIINLTIRTYVFRPTESKFVGIFDPKLASFLFWPVFDHFIPIFGYNW